MLQFSFMVQICLQIKTKKSENCIISKYRKESNWFHNWKLFHLFHMWLTIDMPFKLVRSNFNFSHWLANHTLQNWWKRAGLNKSFTVLPCLDIFNFLCQNPGSNLLRRGLLGCRVWGCFLTIFHLTLHFRNQLGNVFICNSKHLSFYSPYWK